MKRGWKPVFHATNAHVIYPSVATNTSMKRGWKPVVLNTFRYLMELKLQPIPQ
jgi:hypothetical protein